MGNKGKHSKVNENEKVNNDNKSSRSTTRIGSGMNQGQKMQYDNRREKNSRPKKKGSIRNKILSLFTFIFIIMLIVSGIAIAKWYLNNKANQDILDEIAETAITYDEETNESIIDFAKLKEMNSNTVGYIQVNNTSISYPVVQYTDNNYYLKHNFNNEYNSAGWVFMDYRNEPDGTDKNTIIYGHNMRNDSMFGTLKNILNSDWYNNSENKYVTFSTEDGVMQYEVFSVYQIEQEDYYIQTGFSSDTEYQTFLNTISNRSIYDFGVSLTTDDNILTLSTCANNNKYRVVLHAKLVK